MMKRQITSMVAVAALGIGLIAGPALAKKRNCKKLCKNEVAACVTAVTTLYNNCTGLTGADKKTCKKNLKKAKKACKTDITGKTSVCSTSTATTCSPSGAFVD